MHWTAIAARELCTKNHQAISIRVNALASFGCLCFSILGIYTGLTVASYDKFFEASPAKRYNLLGRGAVCVGSTSFSYRAYMSDLKWILSGGLISGFSVCVMHYFEMLGMLMDARISWGPVPIFVSCLFALIGCSVAFWIIFRFLTWRPEYENHRVASAFILSFSTCGMHYVGEFAATYTYSTRKHILDQQILSVKMSWLFVSGISIIFSFFALYYSFSSRYKISRSILQTSDKLQQALEDTQEKINQLTQTKQNPVRRDSNEMKAFLESINAKLLASLDDFGGDFSPHTPVHG